MGAAASKMPIQRSFLSCMPKKKKEEKPVSERLTKRIEALRLGVKINEKGGLFSLWVSKG